MLRDETKTAAWETTPWTFTFVSILLLWEILLCALQLFYRHHTNPVGTEWKWKMDDPDTIVNGAMDNHRNMIKQFRGTKGPRQCLNNERP